MLASFYVPVCCCPVCFSLLRVSDIVSHRYFSFSFLLFLGPRSLMTSCGWLCFTFTVYAPQVPPIRLHLRPLFTNFCTSMCLLPCVLSFLVPFFLFSFHDEPSRFQFSDLSTHFPYSSWSSILILIFVTLLSSFYPLPITSPSAVPWHTRNDNLTNPSSPPNHKKNNYGPYAITPLFLFGWSFVVLSLYPSSMSQPVSISSPDYVF